MKFERETNLYQDQALARKFKSQDTEFEIIQGHINAMISESEIRELINGGKTMYSAMNDIDVDVKGLMANLSELHSTVDENSGQITELDSKQAEYEATLERFSGSLTQVNKDLTGVTGRVTTVEGTAEGLKTSVSEFNTKIANKIDTYFYGYAPTLSNIPASGWNTTELKEAHKDAIFYDTSTGYCYRFTKSGQSYSWVRIKDSDIDGKVETYYQPDNNDPSSGWATTEDKSRHTGDLWYKSTSGKYVRWNGTAWVEITATPPSDIVMAINNKARIFTVQPTPPYTEGDLWVQGESGDIMRCVNPRSTGGYVVTDWDYASKYTDDTVFNNWNDAEYSSFQSFIDQLPGKIRLEVTGSETTDPLSIFSGAYSGGYVPTNANIPASAWSTDEERESHVGDIYCKSTGEIYQYVEGADGLVIRFSEKCKLYSGDWIRIYYQNKNGVTRVSPAYSSLSGSTFFVPALEFWIYLNGGSSADEYYGFSIDSISHEFSSIKFPTYTAGTLPSYDAVETSGDTYPESSHNPYGAQHLWKYTASGTLNDDKYNWALRKDPYIHQAKASIEILDNQIQSKVDEDGVVSIIEQNADSIRLKADKIAWESDYSSMTENGTLSCQNADIAGKINATTGFIGNWTIYGSKIYAGDAETGVAVMQAPSANTMWVFGAGGSTHEVYDDCKFKVNKYGAMYATSGKIANCNIGEYGLSFADVSGYGQMNLLRGTRDPKITTNFSESTYLHGKFRATNSNGSVYNRYFPESEYSKLPKTTEADYSSSNVPYVFSIVGKTKDANIGVVQDGCTIFPNPITFHVWVCADADGVGGRVEICPFYNPSDPGYRTKTVTLTGQWQHIRCVAYPSQVYNSVSCGIIRFYPSKTSTAGTNRIVALRPHILYGEYSDDNLPYWNEGDPEIEVGVETIYGKGGLINNDGVSIIRYDSSYGIIKSELKDGKVTFSSGDKLLGYFVPGMNNESTESIGEIGVEYWHIANAKVSNPSYNKLLTFSTGLLTVYGRVEQSSDKRLKKDVADLDDKYVQLIDKLEPKEYRLIVNDERPALGFIAQDVLQAMGEIGIEEQLLVGGTGEGENYYTLDYNQFIPLLVRKCQMQDARINALEKELSELKDLIKNKFTEA